jgi:menaquinone-9 beta-reductase
MGVPLDARQSRIGDNSPMTETEQHTPAHYDVAIAGGGLAGLAYAILMAREGFHVALFEKESYPFHRVCGEYLSMESHGFLNRLGLPLEAMSLPRITRLQVSDPRGHTLDSNLPLGGIGISRFRLDHELASIARKAGVDMHELTQVDDLRYADGKMRLRSRSGEYTSTVCMGAFGKRSSLDLKWKRGFTTRKPDKLNNHIGVKYHIEYDFPRDLIVLHNFENGYCGMSAIEEGRYCLCYLATAADLSRCGNSIPRLEKEWLSRNPLLREVFDNARFLFNAPVTISQVSFHKKTLIEDHVLLAGDAAGMITPLCGNGMSMALRAAQLAAGASIPFLRGKINRDEMEYRYRRSWNAAFSRRLQAGRVIQSLFGKPALTGLFLDGMRPFPGAVKKLIGLTHGEEF